MHEDEFEGRKPPHDKKILSVNFKYTQIEELFRHQQFWSGLMVLCAGLLIYGTESDEKYLKAVVVRWGISFAIYVALVHAYFAL